MNYYFSVPESRQMDVVLCTDAANEADDQYAITQALLSPKLRIQGIIATQFGSKRSPHSMEDSYQECLKMASLLDFDADKIYRGNPEALPADGCTGDSEGAAFLVEAAHRATDRLYVGVMGPLTDVGAALLLDPSIADKLCVVWTGTTRDMLRGNICREANARKDTIALNLVMKRCRHFVVIPFETYSRDLVSLTELQCKVLPCGKLGRYLFENMARMNRDESRGWISGESWCLGDNPVVGMLLDAHCGTTVQETRYCLDSENRPVPMEGTFTLVTEINVRFILEDLFAKLTLWKEAAPEFSGKQRGIAP